MEKDATSMKMRGYRRWCMIDRPQRTVTSSEDWKKREEESGEQRFAVFSVIHRLKDLDHDDTVASDDLRGQGVRKEPTINDQRSTISQLVRQPKKKKKKWEEDKRHGRPRSSRPQRPHRCTPRGRCS